MNVLGDVAGAFEAGARTIDDISALTGLRSDIVRAAVDHLVMTGRLVAEPLASGCPDDACPSCAMASLGCAGKTQAQTRGRTLRRTLPRVD